MSKTSIIKELQRRHDAGQAKGSDRLNLDAIELISKLYKELAETKVDYKACLGLLESWTMGGDKDLSRKLMAKNKDLKAKLQKAEEKLTDLNKRRKEKHAPRLKEPQKKNRIS